MKTVLYLSASLFFLVAAGLLVTLGIYIPRVTTDLHKTLAVYQQTGEDLDRTAVKMDQVLIEVHGAAHTINQAAASNQKYYQQIARQAAGSEKALRLFLDRTDRSLNDETLPAVNQLVSHLDQNSQATLTALSTSAAEMGTDAQDLDRILANPDVALFMKNMSQTAGHANSTSASVDRTVNYYEKKLTTPAGFAKRMAEWTLDTAAKVGEIFAGFVR